MEIKQYNTKVTFPIRGPQGTWRAIYNQRITKFTAPILASDYSQFLLHAFELQKTIRLVIFNGFAPGLIFERIALTPSLPSVITFVLRFEAAVIELMTPKIMPTSSVLSTAVFYRNFVVLTTASIVKIGVSLVSGLNRTLHKTNWPRPCKAVMA